MRQLGLLLLVGVLLSLVGCLAPYTWGPPAASITSPDAGPSEDSLSNAAELLDQGDEAAAVPHLKSYVQAHPDAVMVQAHLAELLFRQGANAESRRHFHEFVQQAQKSSGAVQLHLIHAHTRLMELAGREEDEFAEELNRGIGLFLLVRKWKQSSAVSDANSEEQTLMKALQALRAAAERQPESARVWYYLGEVYRLLGQRGPAQEATRRSQIAMDRTVTSWERQQLQDALDGHRMN